MYGEGAYGEAAYGETVGLFAPAAAGVSGALAVTETQDIFAAVGNTPLASASAFAGDVLVVVVELELGQL